jgi:hypothetical protein
MLAGGNLCSTVLAEQVKPSTSEELFGASLVLTTSCWSEKAVGQGKRRSVATASDLVSVSV